MLRTRLKAIFAEYEFVQGGDLTIPVELHVPGAAGVDRAHAFFGYGFLIEPGGN